MKLGAKLLLAPLLTGAIALAGGGINAVLSAQTASASADGFRADLNRLRTITQLQEELSHLHTGVYRTVALIGSLDAAAIQAARSGLQQKADKLGQGVASVAGAGAPPAAAADSPGTPAEQVKSQLLRYVKQADSAIDMASVDPNTGVAAMQSADASFKAVSKAMNDIVDGIDRAAVASSAADAQRARWQTLVLLLASVLATGLTLAASAWMLRRVMGAIRQAAAVAEAVSQGNLAVATGTDRHDEIGDLQRALGQMVGQLGGSMQTVQQAAQRIAGAGSEIAAGNQDLSNRTEQAAGNLQQASASLAQLTSAVRQTADSAGQASQLAASAAAVAQRGGEVVGQVVSTMDEINASSKRIADIIGTIDGIAFQTNILALNAAVEAARAGEQGRGFAVVASEVRSLAQRSAAAAREIKTLIGSSVDKVDAGARLVQSAGTTMGEIVSSVQRVTDVIAEITAAAAEQSAGIGQVNGTVGSLDHMTQQNAALVEQSAAAAEHLSEQARALTGIVARFQIAA
jgi:methyl-accepting chemotaxis protein